MEPERSASQGIIAIYNASGDSFLSDSADHDGERTCKQHPVSCDAEDCEICRFRHSGTTIGWKSHAAKPCGSDGVAMLSEPLNIPRAKIDVESKAPLRTLGLLLTSV